MKCIICGYEESKVIDSRNIGNGIRRRRECLKCGARFTTYEHYQQKNMYVIKKDGRREDFNRDKMFNGIRKACEKRPLPTGAIDKLVDNIEVELYKLGKVEIPGTVIGDMVMSKLEELDHIAYIRFASVYREFADISSLKQAVDSLLDFKTKSPLPGQLFLLPTDQLDTNKQRKGRHS